MNLLLASLASPPPAVPAWLASIFWASLHASVLALALLLLTPLLRRRVPARFRFALWLLVILRFLPLPLPESRWSLYNWLPAQKPAAESHTAATHDNGNGSAIAPVIPAAATLEVPPLTAGAPAAAAQPALPAAAPLEPAPVPTASLPFTPASAAAAEAPNFPPASAIIPSTPLTPPAAPSRAPASSNLPTPPSARTSPAAPPAGRGIAWTILGIYLAGVVLMLARLLAATFSLHRILRRATVITDANALATIDSVRRVIGIRQTLPLLAAGGLSGPALVGAFRPRLLLPPGILAALSTDELRLVFLHEAAHLRRRDIPANYLVALVAAMHWFNPLLWLALPTIRAERELACDELVLAHTPDPGAYGHTLLKLVETMPAAGRIPSFAPSVGIIEARSLFTRRIHMIASFRRRSAWLALPMGAALLLAAACVFTSPARSAPAAAAPPDNPAPGNPAPNNPAAGATISSSPIELEADPGTRTLSIASPPSAPRDGGKHAATLTTQGPLVVSGGGKTLVAGVELLVNSPESNELNAEALRKLAAPIGDVKIDQQPLSAVIEYLRDAGGCNITVNWRTMEASGIDRSTPVSIQLSKVPLRKVLRSVLDSVGADLAYMLDDGVITISTRPDLENSIARWKLSTAQIDGQNNSLETIKAMLATAQQQTAHLEEERAKLAAARADAGQITALDRQLQEQRDQLAQRAKELASAHAALAVARPSPEPRADLHLHTYDVHNIIGLPGDQAVLNQDQRAAMDDLRGTVLATVLGPDDTISAFNGFLVISASDKTHDKVQNLLTELSEARERSVKSAQQPQNRPANEPMR